MSELRDAIAARAARIRFYEAAVGAAFLSIAASAIHWAAGLAVAGLCLVADSVAPRAS